MTTSIRRKTLITLTIILLLILVMGVGSYLVIRKTSNSTVGLKLPELSVDLPATMPNDLKLEKAEKIPNYWSPYYQYTYSGTNREVVIVDQLSGWNFNPNEPCMYMTATKNKSGETPINKNLSCVKVASVTTDSDTTADVFKVNITGQINNSDIVPDYYIKYIVHRFAVKATKGTISEQEVKDMAADFNSYNFSNLQNSLAHSQP